MTNRSRFELKLGSLSWVSNSEETRWFLALQLRRPEGDELNRLLTVCNGTVEDYSQPPLYASPRSASQQSSKANARPKRLEQNQMSFSSRIGEILDLSGSFHISIGWALEQPRFYVMGATNAILYGRLPESLKKISVKVDRVKVKIGNVVTSISLSPKISDEESIFGI